MKRMVGKVFVAFCVSGVLLITSANADDNCDLFKQAVSSQIYLNQNDSLRAGMSYEVTAELKVLNPDLIDQLKETNLIVWYLMQNGISGSRGGHFETGFSIDAIGELSAGNTLTAVSTLEVPGNLIGAYQIKGFFTVSGSDGAYCGGELRDIRSGSFEVINESGHADIYPPKIKSTRFLQENARQGDMVTIVTEVEDDSLICGYAEELLGYCEGVWHVVLKSETGVTLHGSNPNYIAPNGSVVSEIEIPDNAEPGEYHLVVHDISDIYGNLFVNIPSKYVPSVVVHGSASELP